MHTLLTIYATGFLISLVIGSIIERKDPTSSIIPSLCWPMLAFAMVIFGVCHGIGWVASKVLDK